MKKNNTNHKNKGLKYHFVTVTQYITTYIGGVIRRESMVLDQKYSKRTVNFIITCHIILLILLLVFLFNIFSFNRSTPYSDEILNDNIITVKNHEKTNTDKLEQKISKLDARDGKYRSTKTTDNNKQYHFKTTFENCIVVGDSITNGLLAYDYLSDEQVLCQIGSSVMRSNNLFASAAAARPHIAFFAFGMNDIGNYNANAEAFTKEYAKKLKKFHSITPKTKIYITSISAPSNSVLRSKPIFKNYIKFNKAIKTMCKKNNFNFINITPILEKNPRLYAADGIHANSEYYPIYLNTLIRNSDLASA